MYLFIYMFLCIYVFIYLFIIIHYLVLIIHSWWFMIYSLCFIIYYLFFILYSVIFFTWYIYYYHHCYYDLADFEDFDDSSTVFWDSSSRSSAEDLDPGPRESKRHTRSLSLRLRSDAFAVIAPMKTRNRREHRKMRGTNSRSNMKYCTLPVKQYLQTISHSKCNIATTQPISSGMPDEYNQNNYKWSNFPHPNKIAGRGLAHPRTEYLDQNVLRCSFAFLTTLLMRRLRTPHAITPTRCPDGCTSLALDSTTSKWWSGSCR